MNKCVNNEKFYWIQIIKKYSKKFEGNEESWKEVIFKASLVFSSNFLSTYQYVQIKSAEFVMNYFQLTFFFWHFWKKIS